MPEFILGGIKLRPCRARRQLDGSGGNPLVHGFDEIFLPGLAFELPGAERQKNRDRSKREQDGHDDAAAKPAPAGRHGASPGVKRPSAAL